MTTLTNDFKIKAQWVADMMKADGVTPEQINDDLVMSYMDSIGKKIQSIQSTYLTRNGAAKALSDYVVVAA